MADLTERARAVTEDLLRHMGVDADVRGEPAEDGVRIEVDAGEHDGILIGHKGETLRALQHVVTRIINHDGAEDRVAVTIDIADYVERREEQLRELALQLAESVRRTGREEMTEPLPSDDRRVIHRALMDEQGLATYSLGDGFLKRLVVARAGAQQVTDSQPVEEHGPGRGRPRHGGAREGGRGGPSREPGRGTARPGSEPEYGDRRPGARGGHGGSRPGYGRSDDRPPREGRGSFPLRGGGDHAAAPLPPSDGRVRDLIRSETPRAKKGSFKIVHLPPGYTPPSRREPDESPDG